MINRYKRGFTLTFESILIIILTISILTLILFFLNAQTGFFSSIFDTFRDETNVDDVVGKCNQLALREGVYSYCCDALDVRYYEDEEVVEKDMTCDEVADMDIVSGRIDMLECDIDC